MSIAAERATKSFRTTEEVKLLVTRLAALQNVDEGDLLSAMLDAYLLVHSPSFTEALPAAREVVNAKPSEVEAALARFRRTLAGDFGGRLPRLTQLPSARERLRAKRG